MAGIPSLRCRNFSFLLFILSFTIPFCRSDDLQLLLQLKSTLNNSSPLFDTWTEQSSPCNFTGILCDSDQKVQEINLSAQNLSGQVPFDVVCSLESLQKLYLGSNTLSGGISDHLSNCTGLRDLDLSGNYFSGEVPDLSPLRKLESLKQNSSGFN